MISTPRCLPWLGSTTPLHNTQYHPCIACHCFVKSAHQFPTGTSPYFTPPSTNLTTLTTNASRTWGKRSLHPLIPLHRYNSPLSFEEHHTTRIVLGTARCLNTKQTSIARPHLTGDVPDEHLELIQPSSSGGRESPLLLHSTFRLHSEHVQGRGAGSENMPYVESGVPTRAKVGGHLRRFPVLELGRAWIGPLWSNRAGLGPQRFAFCSSPHPSPGAYKRGSAEPLDSLCSLLGSSLASSLRSLSRYRCAIARTCFFFESLL